MKTVDEHDFVTYPRRFIGYKWYKPLFVGLLYLVFNVIFMIAIDLVTKLLFPSFINQTGYDDMDFFTAAGAFNNGISAAIVIPCLVLAALIVKDRPLSSYFSSMGGWRWKVFLKTLTVGFIIFGIPSIIRYFLMGKTNDVLFTLGGFLLLTLFIPLQGIGEEMLFRGYIMQTAGSWIHPVTGVIIQALIFTMVHPYNIIGVISIAVSAVIYALICIFSKGIESPSALHILNNSTEIYMAGFGYGLITAEQTIPDTVFTILLKVLFLLFIVYADKKLHWFDEVKYDDAEKFNSREIR